MTQREFLESIAQGVMNDEMATYAAERIVALDTANEKRRETNAVKRAEEEAERAPIREAIMGVMSAEPKTATTLIAEAGVEIKPQAIPSLLKGAIEAGTVVKVDVKVKGKGTQRGYQIVGE